MSRPLADSTVRRVMAAAQLTIDTPGELQNDRANVVWSDVIDNHPERIVRICKELLSLRRDAKLWGLRS